jgi:SWI/SNF-related matrix-associated actin-dependent regulator of chromatin subfamily A protein 2/4
VSGLDETKSFVVAYHDYIRQTEYQLASRSSYRINELQTLPSQLPEDLQLHALTELRALRLENFHAALRARVARFAHPSSTLETAFRDISYTRQKPLHIRDVRWCCAQLSGSKEK